MTDVRRRPITTMLAAVLLLPVASCGKPGGAAATTGPVALTVASANGAHVFRIERARTAAEQEKDDNIECSHGAVAKVGVGLWQG